MGCPNCGIAKKSGKGSCCAPGGAWFKNCGDAGDTKFDHTWTEGVQACKDVETSFAVESPRQAMLRYGGLTAHPVNDEWTRNKTQRHTNVNYNFLVSDSGNTLCKDYFELLTVVVCICAVLTTHRITVSHKDFKV